MKILYVEDELAHVELARRTLDDNLKEDFALLHCASLQEALNILNKNPDIDIVLSDLRLPDGSGLDLLKRIRERPTPPPVVLVTGQGDEEAAVAALKAGAADYLVKQSDYLHRLPIVISNAIAQNRLFREQMALREAEIKYQSLVEQIPAVVFLDATDENETTIYISPRVEELTGFTPEDWHADPFLWENHIHPEDKARILEADRRTHNTGERFREEYRFIRRDGRVIWIKEDSNLIRDKDGNPLYWQGLLLDITHEKEAQAAIQESEERFRRVFHASPIATCIVTLEEGRFIDANLAFLNLVGVSLENLIGRTSLEMGFWEQKSDRDDLVRRLKEQGSLKGIEVQYKNVPHGPRETLAYYELVELGGQACVLAMFYDVTEQKNAQKALQAERDFALQILNTMGQGLTVSNEAGVFEYVNPAYAKMIGYSAEELIGKQPADFTHPSHRAALEEERKKRQSGITSTYESVLIHKSGRDVPVTITGVPRWQQGQVTGTIAVVTDLTLQKQTEKALARQVQELKILHAVSVAGTESDSEDEFIEKVVQITGQIYNEVCGILLLNEKGDTLTPHPSFMGVNVEEGPASLPITMGITGKCVSLGKTLRIGNVAREPVYIEIVNGIQSEMCVPIRVNKRIIGVFDVESKTPYAFDEEDERFLNTIAGSIGTSLERLRLFKAVQRRARELSALYQATHPLVQSLKPEVIANNLLATLDELLGHEYSSIYILDENSDLLTPLAISPKAQNPNIYEEGMYEFAKQKRKLGDGIIGWVAKHGKPIRTGDVSQEKRYLPVIKGIRSELCVPLISREKIIGALNIETTAPNAYTERDEELLSALANSAAMALENARLYETELARREQAENLREVTSVLSSTLNIHDLYRLILESLKKLVPYDSASIFLETENGEMEIVAAMGFPPEASLIGRKVKKNAKWHELALSRKAMIIPDTWADSRFEKWRETEHIRSWLGVPMISQDKIIGFINLDSRHVNAFTEREATLIQTFANSAAVAIQNAKLFDSVKIQAQREAALLDLLRVTSSSLDIETVMMTILGHMTNLIPSDTGTIQLLEGNHLRVAAAIGFDTQNTIVGRIFPLDQFPLNRRVVREKTPIAINQVRDNAEFIVLDEMRDVQSFLAVPLIFKDEVIGMATLASRRAGRFSEEEVNFAFAIANHAAIALGNARLYEETQTRLREMEVINRLSTSLRMTQSQSEMLDLLLDETLGLLNAKDGSVWLYDPSTNMLVQRTARGFAAQASILRHKPNEGIVGHVFQTGEAYLSKDLQHDPYFFKDNLDVVPSGFKSVCIPIQSTVGTLGALMIHLEASRPITNQIKLLTTLAEITGNAIHRAELFEQSQEQIQRLTVLRDIDSAIASSTDLRVTLNILIDHALKQLRVDAVDILLYHQELQSLTFFCGTGFMTPFPSRPMMRIGEGLAGQVVMKGRADHIVNLQHSPETKRDPLLAREGFVTYIGVPLIVKGQVKGVFEVFHRSTLSPDAEWMHFLHTLAGQAAIAIDNSHLFENLQRSNQELIQAYDTTLEGWARALELRDRETEGHTRRVTDLTMRLARYMGVPESELANIYRGVLLHDIGKMGVPDHILKKTGPLNEYEWEEMRLHPQYAYDLLSPIPFLRPALDIPYCHHEHWDGGGYPRGLKGEQIPLAARIFAIVDIWDALLSDRPYRPAWPRQKVIEYLKEISGKVLDPHVVEAFLSMIAEEENKG